MQLAEKPQDTKDGSVVDSVLRFPHGSVSGSFGGPDIHRSTHTHEFMLGLDHGEEWCSDPNVRKRDRYALTRSA